ncbi:hypothetical protein [Vitreoscilla filiformis]|nr:hypothetical protein [Vitreoscilla filiformis]
MSKSIKEITRAVKAATGKTPAELLLERFEEQQTSTLKTDETTPEERAAIGALEDAIRALPRSLFIETSEHEGRAAIYKRTGPGEMVLVGTVYRKRTFSQV